MPLTRLSSDLIQDGGLLAEDIAADQIGVRELNIAGATAAGNTYLIVVNGDDDSLVYENTETFLNIAIDDVSGIVIAGATDGQVLKFDSGDWVNSAIVIDDVTNLQTSLDAKQATLVSGTNIKTVNGTSLLGSGDLVVAGGGGGSGSISSVSSTIDFTTATPQVIGEIPADAEVLRTTVYIESTPSNRGSCLIEIGDAGRGAYMTNSEVYAGISSETYVTVGSQVHDSVQNATITITNPGDPGFGEGTVTVEYRNP